ncbi:hypothetical protein Q4F19_01660 [Sphingomonas sp. BIUV-7]|uniref:Uncharacterized protein n=1 Tax=Sphingomonas natans TaxID=3063330 RepID=A0ABT8Y434_9SPHN|nr:hypothetical protein [Sphingomonas sp. BIUV-7]MDO6413078.1 hypothetical protein [Sphingomonas sp. BIUV-7]
MRHFLLLALFALPVAAQAQAAEDEPHRLDRLRTEQLNRNAAAVVAKRDDAGAARDADDAQRDYVRARAAYQRRLIDWRARVDACVNGAYDACDRR